VQILFANRNIAGSAHYKGLVNMTTLLCATIGLAYFAGVSLFLLALCMAASKEMPSPCPPREEDQPTGEVGTPKEAEALNS
jgi:hypothetical protein